ncbi:T9SS type A sorting domain-containing protein [Pontibacter harenae]|uniref:T9SS type A sorting domain-containing protein n=1 Tax=Pontibacter harenae TaxID=2894083 RepID=UPI001E5378E2|nr:T9SS type A sorting domain-containing protein [Pontibacter harenae]MCC9166989.1 T9SS type A sorting domain-containing protein [Pontibacter harenae]
MNRTFTKVVGIAFSILCFCFAALAQTIEPYRWKNVQMHGGGFVTGVVYSQTEENLVYARTDVGGAYRWDAEKKFWIPLTDHLGRNEQDYTGVLSLATDPSDPDRVYLATGLYTQDWAGYSAILSSTDKGNTWTRTDLLNKAIKLGGNENGRSAGERLRVDPNLGSVLYLGTSTNGLWKSADYGATWNKVNNFPVATSPIGSGGISFVLFDKTSGTADSATPVIYVGVLQTGNNLFRSTDGGSTWQAVPNQPTNYMPHQAALAADRTLYLTYANGPGPNGVTAGAVYKLNTGTNQFTAINPPSGQGGYAGLALDPQKPNTLMVSTLNRWWPRDEIFRSTDGGATWKPLLANATWDHTLAPYAASSTPYWIGDVDIDPFNSDNGWFVTGYGLYNSNDLTAAESNSAVKWFFQNDGLEETVPLKLISPSEGAPLISALGDIDGFKHDDLDASPAAGRLAPTYGTNTSIAFAEKLPSYMVRTYNNADGKYGSYSADGGDTWTAFASFPAGTTGGGHVAVSADGKTIVWAPAGVSGLFYSKNNGQSWTAATGTSKRDLKPAADRVNANKFYVFDAEAGTVLSSTNSGAAFSSMATGLPTVFEWQTWAAAVYAALDVEGDVWLTNPASNGGLYRSTESGRNFRKISSVQEAVKVGFGKVPAGRAYPAVYIAGKVNNINGFFRSDDAGSTWIRINDDAHQFGGVNDITGDPRVYGRVYVATAGRGIVYGDTRNDCNGDLDGTAFVDECNECVGGNTGRTACVVNGMEDEQKILVTYAPNPFTSSLKLGSDLELEYKVYNMLGAEIETGVCRGTATVGAKLKPGIYFLVVSDKKRTNTIKIVKL